MALASHDIPKEYYKKETDLNKLRWWAAEDDDIADYVFSEVERIRKAQSMREKRLIFLSQLYQNEDISSFRSGYFMAQDRLASGNRITMNVIKSCTDTLVSKIGTKKPRPVFLTKKGNWNLQRRAKNLSKYIEGVFQMGHAWREGRMAMRDACITGTGCMKIKKEAGKIVFQRINEAEIIVDEYESMYGKPPQLFHSYWEQKDKLIEEYPKLGKLIDEAATLIPREGSRSGLFQMVQVIEAWRPASDLRPGKFCKVIKGGMLESEDYKRPYYPFVFCPYTKKLFGFYGLALSEDIIGIQLEINKILRTIAKSQHLMSVPHVWLEVQNRGVASAVTNKPGAVRYYKGSPPLFFVPQAMSPEVYQQFERLYERAYQITGISQLSAQGKKPSGVDAKVALRELQDIEAERFQATEQMFDEMFLDAVPIVTDLTDELAQENGNLLVKVANKREMNAIEWKDVRMELEDYTFQLFPTSLLPSQPSARLQAVQEMMQSGIYDRETAVSLLDFPDVDAANSEITATRDAVLRILADIEDGRGYSPPEPEMDLEYSRKLATLAYLGARNDDAPPDVLEDMLGFIADIDGLRDRRDEAMMRKQAEAQAAIPGQNSLQNGMSQDVGAIAQPAPAPVSELMPIAQ